MIHIAGTNGKGSTAVMIASILEEAGYSVGLFTSPHLESECERVQIWDGVHRMIDRDKFDALRDRVRAAGENVKKTLHLGSPTVFETYTAAAYLYFREQQPDYVVLETGLGGRLDSTNTIEKPLACVITQVGMDHTAQLGGSIDRIAGEKAGIIKTGVPVVSQTDDPAVKSVLKRAAAEKGAEFIDASGVFERGGSTLQLPVLSMAGEHQMKNAVTAALAVKAAGIEVSDEATEIGLSNAYLPGRFEIIEPSDGGPLCIIDGAHNPDAIEALIRTYNEFAGANKIKRTLVIFGCMKDKDSVRMVQLLTEGLKDCSYAATAADSERAEDPGRIGDLISAGGHGCKVFATAAEAWEYARDSGFGCVLACGSIYLAGELRELIMKTFIIS